MAEEGNIPVLTEFVDKKLQKIVTVINRGERHCYIVKNDFRIKLVRRNEGCKIRHLSSYDNGVIFHQRVFKMGAMNQKLGRFPQVFHMPTFVVTTTNVIIKCVSRV